MIARRSSGIALIVVPLLALSLSSCDTGTRNGIPMYRGHFSSMVSSLANSGVLLYDTVGVPPGEVWMTFTRLDGAPDDDPRSLPDIAAYFRKQGKLRESR